MTPTTAALVAALQIHTCQNMKEIIRLQEQNQAMLEKTSILLKGKITPTVRETGISIREAGAGAREVCKEIIKW